MFIKPSHLRWSPIVAAMIASSPALAQEPIALEEIIVTAQKVSQNLQDVPIAVTAVSGDEIDATGAVNIEQLTQIVPSLNYRKGTTSANSALLLRGVGTITFSIAAEPSVSTVVDGVVLSRSGQAFSDIYDIERMEVLRGPQGTLFGKNASAGVVNIVTKGGTEEVEGKLTLSAFDDDETRLKFNLSGPLSENLSGRITGFTGSYDGNITNINNGGSRDVNGYDRQGGRLVLDWQPSDDASIRFSADYSDSDDDCCAQVTIVSVGPVVDNLLGYDNTSQGFDTRLINHDLITQTLDETYGASIQGDFTVLGDHTFTAIAAVRNWQNTEVREGDFHPGVFVNSQQPGQPGFFNAFQLHDLGVVETDQQSLELRLSSNDGEGLDYQTGLFYWKSENTQQFTRESIQCNSSNLPVDPVIGAAPCNLTDFANTSFPTATSDSAADQTNYAIFGQATHHLSDSTRLIGGLRYTKDEVDYTHFRAPGRDAVTGVPAAGRGVNPRPAGGFITAGGNGTNLSSGSIDNSAVSGNLIFQYDINDNINSYASYTRGYKGPAFNVFFNHTNPNNAVPIDEETSDAYELGLKTRLLDDRLQLNAAIFKADYEGFQANNFVTLSDNTVVTNLTNAGTVSTEGFEIDFSALATENWVLSGGIAYAKAEVKEFNPNPNTNAPDARNGTQLPLAPELSYSLVSDLSFDFMGLDAGFRLEYSYQDEQFSDLGEGGPLPERKLLGASLSFMDKQGKYKLSLVGRNLLDESYIDFNNQNGRRVNVPRDADRYFGIVLEANL